MTIPAEAVIALIFSIIGLIISIIVGTVKICTRLGKIDTKLVQLVPYSQCSENRKNCPCFKDMEKLEHKLEKIEDKI